MKVFYAIFLLQFVGFTFLCAQSQLSGSIRDEKGEPLAFATVYLKGTSKGTTSNVQGNYTLDLQPGTYELVFQYVGFAQQIREVVMDTSAQQLDVVLREQSVELEEVVVKANEEDPAYRVIRAAIDKRKYHYEQVEAYSCDVYVKGNIKFLDAPEKILGQELGDLGGTLDSNRQGIVYLSESQAELYYKMPDKFKEVMISSKVSGNDNGFGFNRASDMDFNLYRNYSEIGRQIISPIANNALGYYRYRLESINYDEEGRLINKIRVIPKRDEDPTYRGYIYIIEDLWNIQSVELSLLSSSMKQPGLDTLNFNQVYVPVDGEEVWKVFSQTISFKAGFLGFRLGGTFTGIYTDYETDITLENKLFNGAVFKVEDGANEQNLDYWQEVRPIPLTEEEGIDYIRKDSLQELRQSKPYLDSVDRENNKFGPLNLLFGYSYDNSYEKESFAFNSPFGTLQFNTVQGWNVDIDFSYRKEYDDYNMRWLSIRPKLNYGFSDQQLRASAALTYNFNRTNFSRLTLVGGRTTEQFNDNEPISNIGNTLATLWSRNNYMKLYDKEFGAINYQRELFNGVFLQSSVEYARRSPLLNNSDYSLRLRDEVIYRSNDPLDPNNFEPSFEPNEAMTLGISLRLRLKQRYSEYPGRKYLEGSPFPDLLIGWRKGVAAFGSSVNYDLITITLRDSYIPVGVLGRSEFRVQVGRFINKQALEFMDFQHFNGSQLAINRPSRYSNAFLDLPYYQYSTNDAFVQAHFQHFFEGFLLDKTPFLRKLGWSMVAGVHYVDTPDLPAYTEFTLGVENVGFGLFRIFRLEGYLSHMAGTWRLGGVFGVDL